MMTEHLKITFSSLTDEIPNNNGDKLNNNGTFDEVGSGSILDTDCGHSCDFLPL